MLSVVPSSLGGITLGRCHGRRFLVSNSRDLGALPDALIQRIEPAGDGVGSGHFVSFGPVLRPRSAPHRWSRPFPAPQYQRRRGRRPRARAAHHHIIPIAGSLCRLASMNSPSWRRSTTRPSIDVRNRARGPAARQARGGGAIRSPPCGAGMARPGYRVPDASLPSSLAAFGQRLAPCSHPFPRASTRTSPWSRAHSSNRKTRRSLADRYFSAQPSKEAPTRPEQAQSGARSSPRIRE